MASFTQIVVLAKIDGHTSCWPSTSLTYSRMPRASPWVHPLFWNDASRHSDSVGGLGQVENDVADAPFEQFVDARTRGSHQCSVGFTIVTDTDWTDGTRVERCRMRSTSEYTPEFIRGHSHGDDNTSRSYEPSY